MNREARCILLLVLMRAVAAVCLDALCVLRSLVGAPRLSNMDEPACLHYFFSTKSLSPKGFGVAS